MDRRPAFRSGIISKRLREKEIALTISDDALAFLMEKGTNLDMGARPLRRAVEKYIEDPLSEEMLLGRFQSGDHILADLDDTKTVIFIKKDDAGDGGKKEKELVKQ